MNGRVASKVRGLVSICDFSPTRDSGLWSAEFIPPWATIVNWRRNKFRAPEKSQMRTTGCGSFSWPWLIVVEDYRILPLRR